MERREASIGGTWGRGEKKAHMLVKNITSKKNKKPVMQRRM